MRRLQMSDNLYCPQFVDIVAILHLDLVTPSMTANCIVIGSGNGLLSYGTKPLPGSVMTY